MNVYLSLCCHEVTLLSSKQKLYFIKILCKNLNLNHTHFSGFDLSVPGCRIEIILQVFSAGSFKFSYGKIPLVMGYKSFQ